MGVKSSNLESKLANPVSFEVRVPAEAFTTGNPVIPEAAAMRVARLADYDRLFNGAFDTFLEARDLVVRVNTFRKSAVWLADELMATPPELDVEQGEHLTTPRFRESLLEALHNVLVDYNRFGTGMLRVQPAAEGRWECAAPLPLTWYPISETAQAFVTPRDGAIEVVIDNGGGRIETYFFAQDEEKFGQLIPSADGLPPQAQVGTEEAWGVLADSSVGRTSVFIPITRRPVTGDWGLSLYADVWSLIFEAMRRLSQMSTGLGIFGDLKYTLERDGSGFDYGQAKEGYDNSLGQGSSEQRSRNELDQRIFLDKVSNREHVVLEPPKGYSKVSTLQPEIDFFPHVGQYQLVREEIFSAINIPPALYGLTSGRDTPSGKALDKEFKVTAAVVKSARETAIKAIRKALIVGAIVAGHGRSEVEAYADRIVITWPNDFDSSTLETEGGDMVSIDEPDEEENDLLVFGDEEDDA